MVGLHDSWRRGGPTARWPRLPGLALLCRCRSSTAVLLLTACGIGVCPSIRAAFSATGEVRCTAFEHGEATSTFVSAFRVSVADCKVRIQANILPDDKVAYYQYASDGTNSMFLIRYREDQQIRKSYYVKDGEVLENVLKLPQSPRNLATVILRPDVVPEYGFDFCHGCVAGLRLAVLPRCYWR